jgi:hypothetical protein
MKFSTKALLILFPVSSAYLVEKNLGSTELLEVSPASFRIVHTACANVTTNLVALFST